MPNLHELGLKMRECNFKELSSPRVGPCPSLHYPLAPQEGALLRHMFCLTGHEWSLAC